jgi:hypothetical protein
MLITGQIPKSKEEVTWQPSPHVLLRFAGKSYEEMDRLKFRRTAPLLAQIIALRAWLAEAKAELCDGILYDEIGRRTGKQRGLLVALRRAIFNDRATTIAGRRVLRQLGNSVLRRQALAYLRQHGRLNRLLDEGRRLFEAEMTEKRRLLQESFGDPNFQKGVLLASPSLFAGLQNYLRVPPERMRARERQVEAGAFRYFSRMSAKTSPFGRFGPLGLASVAMNASDAVRLQAPPTMQMRSVSHFNLGVVSNLATSLSRTPELRDRLAPRVNYTYYLDGSEIVFIRPKFEEDQPVYASLNTIRRGNYLPPMQRVVEFLEEEANGRLTLSELVTALAAPAQAGESAYEATKAFVARLVQAGLILSEFRLPSDSYDRLIHLQQEVLSLANGNGTAIAAALQQLHQSARRFATAPVNERQRLQAEMERLSRELMQWWRPQTGPKVERSDFVIEDAVVDGLQVQLGRPFFAPLLADIGLFLDCIHARDRGGLSYAMLQDIFGATYGEGGRCRNLMKFALDHMRITINSLADRNLADTTLFPRSSANNDRVLRYMAAMGNDTTPTLATREMVVAPETLRQLTLDFGGAPHSPLSSALNLQVAADSWEAYERGDFLVVFNYALPGFGHFFSRYCHLFDNDPGSPPLTAQLRTGMEKFQSQVDGGHELVEILSVLDHNAQVHPCLTERQIVPPNETSTLPAERQIPFRSLELEHDPETDQLRLLAADGQGTYRPIVPMYMGFFHMMALPSFHRILVDLSPTGYHMDRLKPNEHREGLLPYLAGDPANELPVRHYPRLRIGRFVLQREMWAFPPQSLPPADGPDEFDRFLAAYSWAREHDLPTEVFLRVKRERRVEKFNSDFRTAHKPMLVDFENYFTLQTFFDMIGTDDIEAAHIEEMLPHPRQLPLRVNGERYVLEFQIEFNREAQQDV